MPWWGWVAVGAILLTAEIAVVDLEFYLVFLGISALIVGGVALAGHDFPIWGQWLLFAALSVVSLFVFRSAVYSKLRPPPEGAIPEGVAGEFATAEESIAPGAFGSVTLRGAPWSAVNNGSQTLEKGARCRVTGSSGTQLELGD
ncbi:MAG: NfeD family protein [Myxococcota bacterium]